MKPERAFRALLFALVLGVASLGSGAEVCTNLYWSGQVVGPEVEPCGKYDLLFRLFDSESGGTQVGQDCAKAGANVFECASPVRLSFGTDIFDGQTRWLEVGYRCDPSDPYTLLQGRHALLRTDRNVVTDYIQVCGNTLLHGTCPTVQAQDATGRLHGLIGLRQTWDPAAAYIAPGNAAYCSDSYATERVIVGHSGGEVLTADIMTGNVGIGTTTPIYKLDVIGDIGCVAIHEASDERFKTNVVELADPLEKIQKIRGVSFEWNDRATLVGGRAGHKQIGVVAQDVETVFPELVASSVDGYKSVDYTKLTAVLIEAVKELKAENEALGRRLHALELSRNGE